MLKKFKLLYNPFFHCLLLLWLVTGGILLYLLPRRDLFAFFNSHYTAVGDVLMYYITFMGQPEVIIPVLIALMLLPSLRTKWYFATACVCNLIPLLVQQVLKVAFQHPRPLKLYSDDKAWIHYLGTWPELTGRNSFPSGHSEGAFSMFCFLSLLLPSRYRGVGFIFFFLAIMVCYSRMYLAAHFFEDVYTGSIIGAFTTTILFSFMQKYRPEDALEQLA